ncbi:MlaD family protein [Neolewinella agarilytica]|uniref:MlaD protein n=1 Tax=Neolewinella agarilytica TaxID=478744 RepID=A0A1H9FVB0_9BACT|nr:MlaD family protein [Neolewinella agarilytica]SEQ41851.1 MlaD protein [Neolewinella agarilytica]
MANYLKSTLLRGIGLLITVCLYSCQSQDLIYVSTQNASGIKTGTPVVISGLPIGTVSTIELENRTVWLGLAIDPEFPIGDEADFIASTLSFSGAKTIVINNSQEGSPLQNGDTLHKSMLRQQPIFTDLDSAKVDTLKQQLLKTGEAIIDLLKDH